MSQPTPRLRKQPCIERTRAFEQTSYSGDPHEIIDYLLNLRENGTIHIHVNQGVAVITEWDHNHQRNKPVDTNPV
jgi:hypothetical protein